MDRNLHVVIKMVASGEFLLERALHRRVARLVSPRVGVVLRHDVRQLCMGRMSKLHLYPQISR